MEAFEDFIRWARVHWRVSLAFVVVIAIAIAHDAIEQSIYWLTAMTMQHVLVPLLPLAIVVWAILFVSGYGRLWGKKGGK
jgi:hypothetical protein